MTKINLEYFGMPGSGATVKEAKLDAGHRIEAALNDSYAPVLVRFRGIVSVMSRAPLSGWGYRFVHSDAAVISIDHCSSGFEDRDDCLARMLLHIADVTAKEDEVGDAPAELAQALPNHKRAWFLKEWAGKVATWKNNAERKQKALAAGLTEEQARNYASAGPWITLDQFKGPASAKEVSLTSR